MSLAETEYPKEVYVWSKGNASAILFRGLFIFFILLKYFTSGKINAAGSSLSESFDTEFGRKRVDCFYAYTIKANRFLKSLGVILCASIDLGRAVH